MLNPFRSDAGRVFCLIFAPAKGGKHGRGVVPAPKVGGVTTDVGGGLSARCRGSPPFFFFNALFPPRQ